jgi:hypothetical protein
LAGAVEDIICRVLGLGRSMNEKYTAVGSDLPPDASPPIVVVVHEAFTVTGYDPTTETGDIASKAYTGGKCNGATFD